MSKMITVQFGIENLQHQTHEIMEDALMALIPFIADKVGSSLTSSRSESVAPSGQSHTPANIPTLPVPRNTTPVETHSSGPRLVVPFQQEWYGLTGTETGTASITISELSSVKDIIKFYQNATLIEVEAAVFAYAPSVDKPLSEMFTVQFEIENF